MKEKYFHDLHTHSYWSDGDVTIQELIRRALKSKLQTLILTDHANIGGWGELKELCKKNDIKTVIGVELTCVSESKWFDILLYDFDSTNENILSYIDMCRKTLEIICNQYISWLQNLGEDITIERIRKYFNLPMGFTLSLYCINKYRRNVLAVNNETIRLNIRQAHVRQIDRSEIYLKELPTLTDVCGAINKTKGLVSLAHPIKTAEMLARLTLEDKEYCLNFLLKQNVHAYEAYHSGHSKEDIKFLVLTAQKKNFLITGGSDFHGDEANEHKPTIFLGYCGINDEELFKLKLSL